MPSEKEIVVVSKAAVYDLIEIIDSDKKETYTPEEIKALMKAYISGIQK